MSNGTVKILAGCPGRPGMRMPSGAYAYPGSLPEFISGLEKSGITHTVEHSQDEIELIYPKGGEVWVPILSLGSDVLMNIGSGLLTSLLWDLIRSKGEVEGETLRLQWSVTNSDGSKRELKIDGPPQEVISAVEAEIQNMIT
ncbi:hypothetical protein [Streptomyces sp. NPDC001165]|uniref:hypothetical protein n=1 Tax=Streptomyces sp. NPDC001165 TaxID=3364546 RepID=UPI0036924EED